MAISEISETQYVMGFLSEYFDLLRSSSATPRFLLPTTSQEPILGADFIVQNVSGLDFFQFKRSDSFRRRRGRAEINAGIPRSFTPYYRFKIYNQGTYPQFDRLRQISSLSPFIRAYYCAPKFHLPREFHAAFYSRNIISLSAIINCSQFNNTRFYPPGFDINDGSPHFIVFNRTNPNAFLCSEAKEVDLSREFQLNEKRLDEKGFEEVVGSLYLSLMEHDKEFRDSISSNATITSPIEETLMRLYKTTTFLSTRYNIHTIIR